MSLDESPSTPDGRSESVREEVPLAGIRVVELAGIGPIQLGLTRTRDEWAHAFAAVDGCVTPVLNLDEAPHDPHLAARGTFTDAFGVIQPQPAPRFSRTPGGIRSALPAPGADSHAALSAWGFSAAEIDDLVAASAVHEPDSAPA
ncbi:CoA transferase [Pseudofrankia sp. BMG5.36]|uniref:CoA transferase n=1 Tax=Pseudofrankia sp. BMG5.36 TaxID=1834512 RepID=UPI0008DAFE7E|nr:CoA transferase [Pseudofrankia sp. BMG5.36]OHV44542.1 hypothetical protein BCD48_25080 [Pseudofrankia sp. BMG5.36]